MTIQAESSPFRKEDIRGGGTITVNGKIERYTVLQPNYVPTTPFFAGYLESNLYISEKIAWRDHPTWATAVLTFEIMMHTSNDLPWWESCRPAFATELTLVPPAQLNDYLIMRLAMLNDQLEHPRPGSGGQNRNANRALRDRIVDLQSLLTLRPATTRYLEALTRFN